MGLRYTMSYFKGQGFGGGDISVHMVPYGRIRTRDIAYGRAYHSHPKLILSHYITEQMPRSS